MNTHTIKYKSGYKYQLVDDYKITTDVSAGTSDIVTDYIVLTARGELTIKKGYAWDGPSGPTFDTKTFMRGSLVHDALYQLIRNGFLDAQDRKPADDILRTICRQDGMCKARGWWVYLAVRWFAKGAVSKKQKKDVQEAPKNIID